MTATDELRALLDERGVEWEDHSDESSRHTVWNGAECWFTEFPDGWTALGISKRCTPAQVIEVTLGRGTCHDEGDHGDFCCSECGMRMFIETSDTYTMIASDERTIIKHPNFCPNCGRRIVVVDG